MCAKHGLYHWAMRSTTGLCPPPLQMALNLQVLNTGIDMLGNSKHLDSVPLVSKIVTFTALTIQLREGKGESKLKRRCWQNWVVLDSITKHFNLKSLFQIGIPGLRKPPTGVGTEAHH